MDTLFKKWDIYPTDRCPSCNRETETNEHIWTCNATQQEITQIANDFRTKFHIPMEMQNDVIKAIAGVISIDLSQMLKENIKGLGMPDEQDPDGHTDPRLKTDDHLGAILSLVRKGFQKIWKPRNAKALLAQKEANITKKDKNPTKSKWKKPIPMDPNEATPHLQDQPGTPRVIIDDTSLNKKFDAYRCKCGLHSLVHSPGRKCDQAGLVIHRAGNIALSAVRNQKKILPYILSRSVLHMGGPNY